MKKEESIQLAVSSYLRLQYPEIIFTSESSGLKLPIGQAVKAKKLRSSKGLPDLIILHPRKVSGYHFAGLCLELKVKSPYLKDGRTLKNDDHLQEQYEVLKRLASLGYMAVFVTGFDEAKKIIDNYLTKAA